MIIDKPKIVIGLFLGCLHLIIYGSEGNPPVPVIDGQAGHGILDQQPQFVQPHPAQQDTHEDSVRARIVLAVVAAISYGKNAKFDELMHLVNKYPWLVRAKVKHRRILLEQLVNHVKDMPKPDARAAKCFAFLLLHGAELDSDTENILKQSSCTEFKDILRDFRLNQSLLLKRFPDLKELLPAQITSSPSQETQPSVWRDWVMPLTSVATIVVGVGLLWPKKDNTSADQQKTDEQQNTNPRSQQSVNG